MQQDVRRPGTRSSYWGETGRSVLARGAQHLEALSEPGKHQDNDFVKHSLEYHFDKGVEEVRLKLTLVDIFHKGMEREVCEGTVIRCGEAEVDFMMNIKLYHYAAAVGIFSIG